MKRFESRGRARRAFAVLTTVVLAAAGGVGFAAHAATRRSAADEGGIGATSPYVTWIETRASRAFDQATPQLRGLHVAYRVDAHILLPLGFTSVELWNRPGVGSAVASYRDCETESGDLIRAFELFSSSDPKQAHGFDRRGFFREALRLTPSGVAWTAYFGAMTSWPEKTLSDARKSVDGPQPHTYEAIDGLSTPLDSRAAIFDVSTDGRLHDSADLWSAVRPQLELRRPRTNFVLSGTAVRPLPTLAFLGALQASLRSAAAHRAKPLAPAATRVAFTHNGMVRLLELASVSQDAARGRRAVTAGLARNAGDVFELRYRIVNPGFDNAEFKLWAELPAGTVDDALTPPLPPLGWELQLRSYLKLVFERVS